MKILEKLCIGVGAVLFCMSCQSPSVGDDESGDVNASKYSATITIGTKTSEMSDFVVSKTADAGTFYATYLFSPDSVCLKGYQNYATSDMSYSFVTDLTPGVYTACSLVGYANGEGISSSGLKPTSKVKIPKTLHNLFLGSTTITVTDSAGYHATITATRLMAQLSVFISNVPSDVKTVSVILPSQASQFTMAGDVVGTGTSQTIELIKGAEDENLAGYFTWGIEDQTIFPSADGCTSMPIKVVLTYNDKTTKTIESVYEETTEGNTCCTRGTSTTLTSRMTPPVISGVKLDESFKSVNKGTFSLGE